MRRLEPRLSSSSAGAGRPFGDYLLLHELGRGCHGVVFLGVREGQERQYAIKVLLASADAESVARFHVEVQAASKIDDPGVIKVVDVGHVGDQHYYAMEFCPGETLRHRLRRGPLPQREAAELIGKLARTLQAVHSRGVLHRDLKPSNVILDESTGHPRITDFGLARDRSMSRMTRSGETLGTPYFMAPEQTYGTKDLDERVDVYALGVILYRCLAGVLPFPGSTLVEVYEGIQGGKFTRPGEILLDLSPELEAICLAAMHPDREQRTPSAGALAEQLEAWLAGGDEAVEDPTIGRLKVGIGIMAVVLIALFSVLIATAHNRRVLLDGAAENLKQARANRAQGENLEASLTLLEEAARGAADDPELAAEIAAESRALTLDMARARFDELLLNGAEPEEAKQALDVPADAKEEVEALAVKLATETFEAERARLAAGGELHVRVLQVAEVLAASDDLLARRVQVALQLARVQAHLAADEAEPARKALAQARRMDRSSRAFPKALEALARHVAAHEAYLGARNLAAEGADARAVLVRLQNAERLAQDDDAIQSRIRLLRLTTLYRRGRYEEVVRLAAKDLWSRDDFSGQQARYLAAMCLLRLERRADFLSLILAIEDESARTVVGYAAGAVREIVYGNPDGVVELAEQSLALDPEHVDARITLAVGRLKQGNTEAATKEIDAALKQAPDHPRAYLVKGMIHQELAQHSPALAAFTRLIQLTEPDPLPLGLRLRAMSALEGGNPQRAVDDLSRLIESNPDARLLISRGLAHHQLEEPDEARADWDRAADADPVGFRKHAEGADDAETRAAMLAVLAPPSAPANLEDALATARRQARRRAGREVVLGLYAKAEEFAAADEAALGRVRVARLDYLWRRGQWETVKEQGKALRDLPGRLGLHARMLIGLAHLLESERGIALQIFEAIWKEDPNGVVGLTSGSAYLILIGDPLAGVERADQALQLDPTYGDAAINKTFGLNSLSKTREAVRQGVAAVRLSPDNPRAYMAVSQALSNSGDVRSARRAMSQCVQLTEPDPPLFFLKGFVRLSVSLRDPAALASGLKVADRILSSDPEDVEALVLRGVLHERSGSPELAEADWKRGLEIDEFDFESNLHAIRDVQLVERIRLAVGLD